MLPLEHNYMFPGGGYQYPHGHILSANLSKLPPSCASAQQHQEVFDQRQQVPASNSWQHPAHWHPQELGQVTLHRVYGPIGRQGAQRYGIDPQEIFRPEARCWVSMGPRQSSVYYL